MESQRNQGTLFSAAATKLRSTESEASEGSNEEAHTSSVSPHGQSRFHELSVFSEFMDVPYLFLRDTGDGRNRVASPRAGLQVDIG
jgi:hypothetical protein